jgi:DNA-binding transcriptional MerR regulator
MASLMSIGPFAQRTGLTRKALRLYDALGLLRPALTDMATGFRYYSPEQVPLARRIQQLRATEMPLRSIQALLDAEDAGHAQLRLRQHAGWLQQRIAGYQQAIAEIERLDRWYERVEQEQHMQTKSEHVRCSFCGKASAEVERMISGSDGVIICNACIERCNEILAEARRGCIGVGLAFHCYAPRGVRLVRSDRAGCAQHASHTLLGNVTTREHPHRLRVSPLKHRPATAPPTALAESRCRSRSRSSCRRPGCRA